MKTEILFDCAVILENSTPLPLMMTEAVVNESLRQAPSVLRKETAVKSMSGGNKSNCHTAEVMTRGWR